MKIRSLAVYIAVGAAFLAVSFWAFLSKGRNPRAASAKYRLGGILLSVLSMLSAASCACGGNTPQVTCYEPVEPADTTQVLCYDVPAEIPVTDNSQH